MRKPHRRAHFLIWLMLAPATIAAAWFALIHAPQTGVTTELPAAIEEAR